MREITESFFCLLTSSNLVEFIHLRVLLEFILITVIDDVSYKRIKLQSYHSLRYLSMNYSTTIPIYKYIHRRNSFFA